MEWRHSASTLPKNIRVQNSPASVLASHFFGSRRHPPHLLSSKGPNYQRRVLLISADANEGHCEGKTPREVHQGGLILARQCPRSPATCFQCLVQLPYFPDLAQSDYHLFSGLKNN